MVAAIQKLLETDEEETSHENDKGESREEDSESDSGNRDAERAVGAIGFNVNDYSTGQYAESDDSL